MNPSIDPNELRDLLLHRLPEDAVARLEERLLGEEGFDAAMRSAETDLLDDYAAGTLDAQSRAAVQRWLIATPGDRERLRFAKALQASKKARPTESGESGKRSKPARHRARDAAAAPPATPLRLPDPARPTRRRLYTLAFLSVAAVTVAWIGQRQYAAGPPAAALTSSSPTITLLANLERGAASTPSASVRIPLAVPALRLQVEVADGDSTSRYSLEVDAGERRVFQSRGIAAEVKGGYRFVEVAIAPALLADGDYRVSVALDGAAAPRQEWTLRTRSH